MSKESDQDEMTYCVFQEQEHRVALWKKLLAILDQAQEIINHPSILKHMSQEELEEAYSQQSKFYKCLKHHDGSAFSLDDCFLSLVVLPDGRQLSYHLPMNEWDTTIGKECNCSPFPHDGHTPDDVLRLIPLM